MNAHRLARFARAACNHVAADLLPRLRGPLLRPLRILSAVPEYRARKALTGSAPPSPWADARNLAGKGYMRIPDGPARFRELSEEASGRLSAAEARGVHAGRAHFSQLLDPRDRSLEAAFMRAALDEGVLATVSRYLGCAAFLEYADLLFSRPVETLGTSQYWHLDRTDRRLVKLFVYCRDVGEENGPFSFLEAPDSSEVPSYVPHYLNDARMARYADLARTIRILGEAGTAILIDTSRCYHFGSRCRQPRLAFVAYYSTGFGYAGRESNWTLTPAELAGLTPLQRAALGHPFP